MMQLVLFTGTHIEVRAAKTTAELSTWSGNNPVCAAVKLTVNNLGMLINCSQPVLARYMTIADMDGDTLPVCAMNALVVAPLPPAPPPTEAMSPGEPATQYGAPPAKLVDHL